MNKIISRKKTRKYLFQKLFSSAYNKNDDNISFDDAFLIDSIKNHIDEKYLEQMQKIIFDKESELIEILKMYAPKFPVEKMDLTYVLPIFIWATEMLYLPEEIPAKVSINEAIEISKTYWTDSAKKIVNWVLNQVYKNYEWLKEKLEKEKNKTDFSFFAK